MFKRLFVLLLLAIATLAVSTPTHASTLTITSLRCEQLSHFGGLNLFCWTNVSGGTGSYTLYAWENTPGGGTYPSTWTTTEDSTYTFCYLDNSATVKVTVTDSAGATATRTTVTMCYKDIP